MSKKAKNENKKKRREQKNARKRANYLRFGPKANHQGRRQKRNSNKFVIGESQGPVRQTLGVSAKGKRRAKLAAGKTIGHQKSYPARPLRPLRKRKHLGASQIRARRVAV